MKEAGRIADMVVIGEPTEFCPVYMHKGYIFVRITLEGVRGHSSDPAKGKNVVERALPTVILRLMEFKQALESIRDARLEPTYPTLNIGKVTTGAGSAKNVIANSCILELDIRPVPGQNTADIINALKAVVAPEGEINGIKVKVLLARAPTPPFATPLDSLILRETVVMSGNQPISVPFNTEGGVFNSVGSESIICGLGSIKQAHQPNEFVEARYMTDEMVERYTSLILRLC